MTEPKTNVYTRSPLANVVVFHEFEAPPSVLKAWYEDVIKFFAQHHMEPIWGSVGGENGQKTSKLIKAKSVFKKLTRHDYEGISSFILLNTPAEDLEDTFGHNIMLWLSIQAGYPGALIRPNFILVYDDALSDFGKAAVTSLLKRFAAPCQPRYGYAFQRPFHLGPEWYVMGTIVGKISDKEGDEMTEWNNKYALSEDGYKLGDLRDVYPYNWLCETHLNRSFTLEGQTFTLRSFIESDPAHGTLCEMGHDRWLWHVADEAQRLALRTRLQPTGLLLAVLP